MANTKTKPTTNSDTKNWENGYFKYKIAKETKFNTYHRINAILAEPEKYYDAEKYYFRFSTLSGIHNEALRIGIDYIYNHKEINESEVSALSEAVGARIAQDLDIDLKNIYELLANQHLVGLENKFYLKQLLTILVEKFGPSYQNIPIKKLLDTTNDSINDLMSLEREKIVNNVSPLKQSTKQNTKIIKSEDK